MALNIDDSNNTTNEQPTSGSGQQQQKQQQQKTQQRPVFGIETKLSTFGSGGETFEKIFEGMGKLVKSVNSNTQDKEFSLVKILKGPCGLNYSGIALTQTRGGVTAAHVLLIEATGDAPESLTENFGGSKYEIIRTPSEAMEKKYADTSLAVVAATLGVAPNSVVIVDGTLVPNIFDPNNETSIHGITENAMRSVQSEIEQRVNGYDGFSISDYITSQNNGLRNQDGRFQVAMSFNGNDVDYIDVTGMPVRQDICLSLKYKVSGGDSSRQINQGDDVIDIVRVFGYIDFEISSTNMHTGQAATKFIPNFVITGMASSVAPTPDILMLGVASVVMVSEDMNWMQAFKPGTYRKGSDVGSRDIGALNVEGNLERSQSGYGARANTRERTFGLNELNRLVQSLVQPNMLISIDVPTAGADTWYMSILNYIKRGDKKATIRLNKYLQKLTSDSFGDLNIPVFDTLTNKIYGGFYGTKEGPRDIRHVTNYLSYVNHLVDTNQNPMLCTQYTNTLYNSSIPTELRASERAKYIGAICKEGQVYKQTFNRLTFSGMFIDRLVNTLSSVNFAPMLVSGANFSDMFTRRSTHDFSNSMLGSGTRLMGQYNDFTNYHAPRGYTRSY